MTDAPKAIHNSIGTFFFDEPDFDAAGGRSMRRVRVPQSVVRNIVQSAIALHEERRQYLERTAND